MLNLSLSGCGFLGIYHVGVISAFREHAPHVVQGNISGCSAGALVAACVACDCCLGQMVSDVLEIALKARSHVLGPLHPSFNIVEIIKNGLRRILPVNAHKICSGRVFVSLTRWRDGKNVLVSQYDTREELIQALVCSTFIPCYSGFLPPKFKGSYYWDGGLSNNNPVLDQHTILVSPFGGESDICPRDESSSYYCHDFQGTNLQLSYENIYRISKALFPPSPHVLKAMCFRGYKDAINFLKSRNMLECSCSHRFIREKTSISSVIGEDLHDFSTINGYDLLETINDEAAEKESTVMASECGDEEDSGTAADDYDVDNDDDIISFAKASAPLNYEEMPTSVCDILDAACKDEAGIIHYLYAMKLSRALSFAFLPWTLPFDLSVNFSKRLLDILPKFTVPTSSPGLLNMFFVYFNLLVQKLTYEKYHYHARIVCKVCLSGSKDHTHGGMQLNMCCHASKVDASSNGSSSSKTDMANGFFKQQQMRKICAKHRLPSICSSETTSQQQQQQQQYKKNRVMLSKSFHSTNASSIISQTETEPSYNQNEFRVSKLLKKRQLKTFAKYPRLSFPNAMIQEKPQTPQLQLPQQPQSEATATALFDAKPKDDPPASNGVLFHLAPMHDLQDEPVRVEPLTHLEPSVKEPSQSKLLQTVQSAPIAQLSRMRGKRTSINVNNVNNGYKPDASQMSSNNATDWDSYWDNMEFSVVGEINA